MTIFLNSKLDLIATTLSLFLASSCSSCSCDVPAVGASVFSGDVLDCANGLEVDFEITELKATGEDWDIGFRRRMRRPDPKGSLTISGSSGVLKERIRQRQDTTTFTAGFFSGTHVTLKPGDVIHLHIMDSDIQYDDLIIDHEFTVDGTGFSYGRLKNMTVRCR